MTFVVAGNHVASLFGVEPVDEVAAVYGGVSWEGEECGGEVRLDGLCDDTAIRELMRVGRGEEDSLFNNLMNGLFIEVGTRRTLHVGRNREGLLDRALRRNSQGRRPAAHDERATALETVVLEGWR
mgnify:FL=1